jgi:hypothetical protein
LYASLPRECCNGLAKRMTNEEKKRVALDYYLYTEKEQKEICQILKIQEQTFTRWKKTGDWAALKATMSDHVEYGLKIVANVMKRALDISKNDGFLLKDIRDAGDAIERFMPKRSDFASVATIGQQYTLWLMENGTSQAEVDAFIENYKKFSQWYLAK